MSIALFVAMEQQSTTPVPAADDEATPERVEEVRDEERSEGMTEERRGSPAAPSDRPEGRPPHPQDVNEIG